MLDAKTEEEPEPMFGTDLKKGIQYTFLKRISLILLASTCVLSAVIAANERNMLKNALETKGVSLASNLAKRNENALIIKGSIKLDSVLSELITDEEIIYTVIADNAGKLMTTQFESINFSWPGLKEILSQLPKDSELQDIIAAINRHIDVSEVSVPIMVGPDTFGKVIIGMSEHKINAQIVRSVLFVIGLNCLVAIVLGYVLFITSRKTILTPIIELDRAADRLAGGELSTQVAITASGEIGALVDSFNQIGRAHV
jgi:methyl-accepting chemotaxis protein